jgi:short-subunit dehydrogenase
VHEGLAWYWEGADVGGNCRKKVDDWMNWDGSKVLITGAASGIGASAARRLAAAGAVVGLIDMDAERLEDVLLVCQRSNKECRSWICDLSDPDLAEQVALDAWRSIGPLDVLINNAAMPSRGRVTEVAYPVIEQVMRVNLFSPMRMSLAILPGMLRRHSGTIINVSSINGRIGAPSMSTDAASKFALCGWSESIALDLWNTGVRIRLVNPGPIDTEFWNDPMHASEPYDGPMVPVEDAVDALLEAIDGEAFETYIPAEMKSAADWKSREIDQFMSALVTMLKPKEDDKDWACAESWEYDRRREA